MAVSISLLYSIVDEKNAVSTAEISIPAATGLSDIIAMGKGMGVLIDALINGYIRRIGLALSIDLPGGIATSASAGSDVEEGARFQFLTDEQFYTAVRLPTFLESLISSGSQDVDLLDADVAAFVTAMEDGLDVTGLGGTGTISPTDKRDGDITTVTQAKEQFLKSRA